MSESNTGERLGHAERRHQRRGRSGPPLNLLYSTLRFIARHVHGFWGAVVAFLTMALVIGLLATGAFMVLAGAVQGGVTQAFDEQVLRWLGARRTPWLNESMLEITTMGSGVPLMIIVAIAVIFLWLTRHHWSVYLLLLGTLGGQVISRLLKLQFERSRPVVVEWGQQVDTFSFPSGHAMSSFVAFGIIAYLVANAVKTRALKRFTWITAAVLIVMVGVSRMYLGVHYPTDVLAGFLAGLAWILLVAASMTALRFFAYRRPETRIEEEGLEATSPPPAAGAAD